MSSSSVGVVAAAINAAVAIVQFVVPNALILALVATLSETQTAVTWSVVARSIHSSHWPFLLRSDAAETNHIPLGSRIVAFLRPVTLLLVAIAAIVTPLGLYEDLELNRERTMVDFVQQPDQSPFGLLTPPRSNLGFSRVCSDVGGFLPAQCPGTNTVIEYWNNGSTFTANITNDDYDRRIPVQLAELYQSGLSSQPSSVSSFFDIGWRWYNTHTRDNIRNHSYLVDSYYPIAPVIGEGDVKLLDGLVVDTGDGGIGFRSHTVPAAVDTPNGAEWDEDILFFLPETACVDTNFTLQSRVPLEGEYVYLGGPEQDLIDNGGFSSISRHNPFEDGWYGDTQRDPQLQARAYRAAWTMNVINMFYFNVTEPHINLTGPIDSHLGKRYAVNNSIASYSDTAAGLMSLAMMSLSPYNGLIDMPMAPLTGSYVNATLSNTTTSLSSESSWPNPYDVNDANFTIADTGCRAFLYGDWANATNIQVKCGLVLGPANKTGGSSSPLVEPGSVWTRPVHMCASATKATIKTVHFAFDPLRGSGLERLRVISIADKQYRSQNDMPLWGIETPNMTISQLIPFWGLIDPEMRDAVNLSTIRSDHLYIPASANSIYDSALNIYGGTDYMPATAAPAVIWESAYAPYGSSSGLQDLSGRTSLSIGSKWRALSASASGTAEIMNLIWTDLAANALIGTRGWLTGDNTLPPNLKGVLPRHNRRDTTSDSNARGNSNTNQVPIHTYHRVIRYHYLYAIPAVLALLLTAIICLAALAAVVSGRGRPATIRYLMNRLSAGRLLVALKLKEEDWDSRTAAWVDESGKAKLSLPAGGYQSVPLEEEQVVIGGKRDAGG